MLGYFYKVVPTADFGRDQATYFKIGYVEDNVVYIAEDCYDHILDKYVISDIVLEALQLLLIKIYLYRSDIDDYIEDIDHILTYSTELKKGGFEDIINGLKEVCDKRDFIIPKSYF